MRQNTPLHRVLILCQLFSLGQTVAVSVESVYALGQHVSKLNQSQLKIFHKSEYVACMLYIANFGCARISVCILIKKLLPGKLAKGTAMVFASFSAMWTISGVLVNAFPCPLPHPWDSKDLSKCYNLVKFVNYISITNIVVEVLLVMIPLFVWNIRMDVGKRVSVSAAFLSRLLIVPAVAVQIYFFNRSVNSVDYTYDYWQTVLCLQVAQDLSVITACLPCFHPFVLNILAGKTSTEGRVLHCPNACSWKFGKYFKKENKFDSMTSQSSTAPMKETEYCRPLATHGLDRSSAHLNSQHFNRFPSNVAKPVFTSRNTEDVFNRVVEIPKTQPGPSDGGLPPPPKALSQVGVLPIIDWDTESDRSSGRSSPSRRRDSDYVFKREKVISVPEGGKMYEEDWGKYPPPPPSPRKF
ncbi:hypothetical protein EJ04DRAFT_306809 [Polyplosphaeria fusca]|uniref:Rhodopsin domain-containing protein n=1 Tax=Polyplosphaeria fusca TaxID=682080 RepID=A0A9P4QWM8_9PLEO|nr:hypothetical protein EJ04DRAFT_306809 [Polyplosphaeria fusca]